jgi:3-hydroxyacyl-CoA dehydrogenase/enoyl-CoA hydratase/3-hydroxybutyryl-CoA epimerase
MPVGPLAVLDEVSLSLALHVREQTRQDLTAAGQSWAETAGDKVLDVMAQVKRLGKAHGAGFYEYPAAGSKFLWPELSTHFPLNEHQPLDIQEMVERLMFIQALETVRCLEEGVLTSAASANIGSIFGWGFAPFKGGTLQYINDYGLRPFIGRAQELAAKYGERFTPPALLLSMAEKSAQF